ncbi:MAG: hypothetical protein K2X27_25220, partial [Candidatus Obscuribacterales bacterium]|nr:hypothetical protein [Candidatus Obscuribacterales bacterium]
QIPLHLLRDLDLDQAVQAILILNDVYGVVDLPTFLISNKESDNAIWLAQIRLQEAQSFCIKWIYQECNQSKSASNTDFWPSLKKLYEFAREYADIWTTMSALHQGILSHTFRSDGCIEIEYVSKQQGQIRATDAILSPRIYFTNQANSAVSQVLEHSKHQNLQSCLNSLLSIAQGKTSIDLSFPKDSFVALVEANFELLDVLWSLNKDWRFGGYSLAELKRVYSVIQARAQIQTGIWIPIFLSTRKPEIFNKIALKQPREHWIDELTEFAGLPRSTVESILSDLTYKSHQRPAMSPSRCAFLELSNNFLVLNNSQVNFANSENDASMSLVDRKDPLHGTLSSMKEAVQLTQIRLWLQQLQYRLFGPLEYCHLDKAGDVDLLVLSEKEKFGLVCELKMASPTQLGSAGR